jgi:hypothetical protein
MMLEIKQSSCHAKTAQCRWQKTSHDFIKIDTIEGLSHLKDAWCQLAECY